MAIIGVSILKDVDFRLGIQPFANVYFYKRVVGLAPGDTEANTIVDEVILKERDLHSSAVRFKVARLWTAGGSRAENEMRITRPLTGTGNAGTAANFDRERAYLVRWPAGKDVRGKPVYFRKWYHMCGSPPAFAINAGALEQTAALSSGLRTEIARLANTLKVVGGTVDTWQLTSSNGRDIQGDAQCHQFLEHHQLGDQWRG